MNPSLYLHLLGDMPLQQLFGLAVPVVAIIFGCSIPIVGMLIAYRRHKLWHETARFALEKGQPLPDMPADTDTKKRTRQPTDDIRSGLILIAVGAALWFFLRVIASPEIGYAGLIPGFIGVALLLNGLLRGLGKAKDTPPPPQA